jgi:hypothetical protein
MRTILIWLSGASPRILRQCPTERPKYLGIGGAILVTSAVSSITMAFALRLALTAPLVTSVILAASWGLLVIALDRWLVVSLVRQANPWNYLILAIPRLILGLLIGIIISTPLILQVFRPTIDQQITVIHKHNVSTYLRQLRASSLSVQISSDEKQITTFKSVITTRGIPAALQHSDLKLRTWRKKRNRAEINAGITYRQWHCQMYGSPGSCIPGDGPLTRSLWRNYREFVKIVKYDKVQVETRQDQLLVNARNRRSEDRRSLLAVKGQLASDRLEKKHQITSFMRANYADTGLLIRLQALDNFGQSGTLNTIRWLLFTLFTTIQCLPIMAKILLNLRPENSYEELLAREEAMLLRAAREDILRRQAARDLG